MERPTFQLTVAAMIGVVGCAALNFWLFRLGVLWGILGLNVTKHVVIAYLCHAVSLDRSAAPGTAMITTPARSDLPLA